MRKAFITPDQDAVISEIEIAAPPERVFQALISRDQALQWGGGNEYQITVWEMDPRPGGQWRLVSRERASERLFEHHGKVLEVDPPRLLVYTWFANWHADPNHPTVVRWELSHISARTHVKVTHSGLGPLPEAAAGYSQGWPGLLEDLRKYCERSL
jgi:uncharacterized protein YndB with AHSA1/START domain